MTPDPLLEYLSATEEPVHVGFLQSTSPLPTPGMPRMGFLSGSIHRAVERFREKSVKSLSERLRNADLADIEGRLELVSAEEQPKSASDRPVEPKDGPSAPSGSCQPASGLLAQKRQLESIIQERNASIQELTQQIQDLYKLLGESRANEGKLEKALIVLAKGGEL